MDTITKRLFIFLIVVFSCISILAYDFKVGGLYYNILTSNTVEVTYENSNGGSYSGELVIPNSVKYNNKTYAVTSIGSYAFYKCSGLTGCLTIPNSVTYIGENAFAFCSSLTGSLTIPNSVTSIENYTFANCSGFTGVLTIPNTITSIGVGAFQGCTGFTGSLTIPNSVTSIGVRAFHNCQSITGALVLPSSLTVIEGNTFSACRNISSLELPNSLTSIGNNAFVNCESLKTVISEILYPFDIPENVFSAISSNAVLHVPQGTKSLYQTFSGWTKNFIEIIEDGSNVSYILSIKATGNGTASYNGTTIRGKTSSFTIDEGTNAKVTFTPDNGYRIKTVKVNDTNVTSSVSNNAYTISNINQDTSLEVEFEAIPPTTYTLSITASGNGSATYNSTTIKNKTQSFTVNEGTNATVTFTPDNGYRIASVVLNNTNVTTSVSNNKYTISNISANTTLKVTFEAIPPTTYTLSITASGNGSATYNSTTIKNKTQSFTVNEGTNATITFAPDNGYRIASVKLNNTDVTSSVSNNQYTISNISQNTTLKVTFEAIPVTTYTLSITASGNGIATYNNTTIRSKTNAFNVNAGANATVTFAPDNGYRIASVKLNNTDVTSSVSSNEYTISNITANTTLAVTFEAIPATTYSLSIMVSGNGSASYNGTSIRNNTQSFTINEGTNATVTFSSDSGYRIASVKVNDTDVTTNVANNRYTIENIADNTTLSVTFEEIPATTYSLNVFASGNGSVMYNDITIRNESRSYTVNEGDYATFVFTPDIGYRIASVLVNNSDVTYLVSNNQYSISNITTNTTVNVTFEAIPVTTYSLSITASGNGSATFNGMMVKNGTQSFTINEGSDAMITFNPDNGNSIACVKVNNTDVTSKVTGNRYTFNNITANTTLEVVFLEDVNALTVDGLNYTVTSQSDKTITFTGGDFGLVLIVPATITQDGTTWKVTGIDKDALKNNTELAAIIWNPEAAFTATVSNPNLLLYVKSAQYAPSTIKNVVVNGTANSITLVDAVSGNNFYCPQSFTAQSISYTHHYSMMTGIGESRGWETIALPFDVQRVTHASKGTIVPFAQWSSGNTAKPFWLYELKSNGFVEASGIKANTPYIISMPNNPQYADQYQLVGNVTFSAENATVKVSDNLQQTKYNDRTFVSNFQVQASNLGYYALNVSNDYFANNSGMTDGSRFVLNMRKILPFEAYMTFSSSNAPESIGIFDDMTTEIQEIPNDMLNISNSVYDLQGRKIEKTRLIKGVYIVNRQKVIIR